MPAALITGASRGLGEALAAELAQREWDLVVDARNENDLRRAVRQWRDGARVTALPGDVGDHDHRRRLAEAVKELGRLDLLVNNASELGPSPQPQLQSYPLDEFERVYRINVFAPLAITQLLLPELEKTRGAIVNVSSDAAVEAYAGWGGYGSSKAALDHLSAVLAAEHPALAVYAFDPGDMRTTMHQLAFPGEDISDRPEPRTVVPALLRLVEERPAPGRYSSAGFLVSGSSG
jgi:NAD(P)-dependent dehydrogenase (short-subunit alcohol dehydrogenase family)